LGFTPTHGIELFLSLFPRDMMRVGSFFILLIYDYIGPKVNIEATFEN
jgi:hypothetical protein